MRLRRRLGDATVLFASASRLAQAALLWLRGSSLGSLADHSAKVEGFATFTKPGDFLHLLGALLCMLCGATAAGLTLGLVSLDPLDIALKLRAGTEEEKRQASRIYPLISRHHLLLVSLLLFNAAANEALPLFLEKLFSPVLAIIFSITIVLLVGEILPSALMTGPKQLALAARGVGVAWVLIGLLWPIAYPLSLLLDLLFGHEGVKIYTRNELAALLHVQREVAEKEGRGGALTPTESWVPVESVEGARRGAGLGLSHEETSIMDNILKSADRGAQDCCTPLARVLTLSLDETFTAETLRLLSKSGYSRIPVYEYRSHNLRGYISIKDLLVLDVHGSSVRVRDVPVREAMVISPGTGLLELLSLFQQSGNRQKVAFLSHHPSATRAALASGEVLSGPSAVLGVCTMDDVLHAVTCGFKEDGLDTDNPLRDRLVHSLSRSIVSALKTMNTVFNDPVVRSSGSISTGYSSAPSPTESGHLTGSSSSAKLDPLAREIRRSLDLGKDINLSALLHRHSAGSDGAAVNNNSSNLSLRSSQRESLHSPVLLPGTECGRIETLEEKSEGREVEPSAAGLPQA